MWLILIGLKTNVWYRKALFDTIEWLDNIYVFQFPTPKERLEAQIIFHINENELASWKWSSKSPKMGQYVGQMEGSETF